MTVLSADVRSYETHITCLTTHNDVKKFYSVLVSTMIFYRRIKIIFGREKQIYNPSFVFAKNVLGNTYLPIFGYAN